MEPINVVDRLEDYIVQVFFGDKLQVFSCRAMDGMTAWVNVFNYLAEVYPDHRPVTRYRVYGLKLYSEHAKKWLLKNAIDITRKE